MKPARAGAVPGAARAEFSSRCGLPESSFHADAFTSEADKAGPAE